MLGLLKFIVLSNALLVGLLQLSSQLTGVPELYFVSDYFFYALIVFWGLGSLFIVTPHSRFKHLKHSPNKATRTAASMVENDTSLDTGTHESLDLSLGVKLFISGSVSLIVCIVLITLG